MLEDMNHHFRWCRVGDGFLCIGHRPKLRSIPAMRRAGVTHAVTILSAKEGAELLGRLFVGEQIVWMWIPLGSSEPPRNRELIAQIRETFRELEKAFDQGAVVFVHCSAGIHRTGMVANALLLHLGYSQSGAGVILSELRQITWDNVGEERLRWGTQFQRVSSALGLQPA